MHRRTKWMISLLLTLVLLFSALGTVAADEPDGHSAITAEETESDSPPSIAADEDESDRPEYRPGTEDESNPIHTPTDIAAEGTGTNEADNPIELTGSGKKIDSYDHTELAEPDDDTNPDDIIDPDEPDVEANPDDDAEPAEPDVEVNPEDDAEPAEPDVETNPDDTVNPDDGIELAELAEEAGMMELSDLHTLVIEDVAAPTTYQEVYDRMIALQETLYEGMTWTNLTPYGTDGPLGSDYRWKGGMIYGADRGVGCAAFAFILSDAAFGSLPARAIPNGSFTFDEVRVGDILRVLGNTHSVIVLQKSAGGVIVAEANYNKSVHWGRVMTEAEVMAANYIITRYPENFISADASDASNIVQSGTSGSLNWSLTKAGVLTISGTGAIPDFSQDSDNLPPWNISGVNTIVIQEGITRIGNYAFYESGALSVYIPEGVKSIGQSAFQGSALVTVTLPGTTADIEDSAFRNCQNLTSATIPEGVTSIGGNAFRGCTALTYIDFPSSITSVGDGAFMDCTKITRVRFRPGSETVKMGENLFTSCWYLVDVALPEKADCISAGMFSGCISLTTLYIPAGVNAIDVVGTPSGSPFANCKYLSTINFGGSETTWNAIGGRSALIYSGLTSQTTVNFNIPFDDPFAEDPDDNPSGDHVHNWSAAWSSNETCHWHECAAADCPVTDNSQKDGYAQHSYGNWVIDVSATAAQSGSRHRDCTVCGYRQTESIPASGSPSNDSGSSSGTPGSPAGSGSSDSSSGTPGNPAGSGNSDNSSGTPGSPAGSGSSDNSSGTPGSPAGSGSSDNSSGTLGSPAGSDSSDSSSGTPGSPAGSGNSSEPGNSGGLDNSNDLESSDESGSSGKSGSPNGSGVPSGTPTGSSTDTTATNESIETSTEPANDPDGSLNSDTDAAKQADDAAGSSGGDRDGSNAPESDPASDETDTPDPASDENTGLQDSSVPLSASNSQNDVAVSQQNTKSPSPVLIILVSTSIICCGGAVTAVHFVRKRSFKGKAHNSTVKDKKDM